MPLAFDVIGSGSDLVLLPAPSSVSTRDELHPLAHALGDRFRCLIPDWPGFGNRPRDSIRPTPDVFRRHLRAVLEQEVAGSACIVACGHAAAYALEVAIERPERVERRPSPLPKWSRWKGCPACTH